MQLYFFSFICIIFYSLKMLCFALGKKNFNENFKLLTIRQHAPTLRQPCANALCADGWSTFAPTRANGVAFLGSQRLENAGKFNVGAFSRRQDDGRKTLCLPPLSYRFLTWKTLDLVLWLLPSFVSSVIFFQTKMDNVVA